jgi:hypothetical protein
MCTEIINDVFREQSASKVVEVCICFVSMRQFVDVECVCCGWIYCGTAAATCCAVVVVLMHTSA